MPDQATIILNIRRADWGKFFDALDVNKDGHLSHQELWKWEKIGDSQELLDALNKFNVSFYEIIRKNMSAFFKKVDKNNDHEISRAEFISHMNLSKYITDGCWNDLFDELDADRNGVLDHSEFWTKMAIRNSSDLVEALNQFDVSSSIPKEAPIRQASSALVSLSIPQSAQCYLVDYALNFYSESRQKQRSSNQSC